MITRSASVQLPLNASSKMSHASSLHTSEPPKSRPWLKSKTPSSATKSYQSSAWECIDEPFRSAACQLSSDASYGALGAESLHPISPLTCTFNFGPISPDGTVSIKIIYDHRTLDGSEVARRLKNIEEVLMTLVRDELLHLASYPSGPKTTSSPDLINASTRQDLSHEIFNPNHDLTIKPASQKTHRLSFETD